MKIVNKDIKKKVDKTINLNSIHNKIKFKDYIKQDGCQT